MNQFTHVVVFFHDDVAVSGKAARPAYGPNRPYATVRIGDDPSPYGVTIHLSSQADFDRLKSALMAAEREWQTLTEST